jgi:hypothetical protein
MAQRSKKPDLESTQTEASSFGEEAMSEGSEPLVASAWTAPSNLFPLLHP